MNKEEDQKGSGVLQRLEKKRNIEIQNQRIKLEKEKELLFLREKAKAKARSLRAKEKSIKKYNKLIAKDRRDYIKKINKRNKNKFKFPKSRISSDRLLRQSFIAGYRRR